MINIFEPLLKITPKDIMATCDSMFRWLCGLIVLAAISVPLAIWKIVDIIRWIW